MYNVRLTTSRSGVTSSIKVLSIKIDLDNSFIIQKVIFKGRGVEILSEFRPQPVLWKAIGNGAQSSTVAASFVLHHSRIGEGAMHKFGTSCQLSNELYFISEWCIHQ
jgi:hypothetical protein